MSQDNQTAKKYLAFLALILIFSIPFYYWGYAYPVAGLPFGLPISFLMILVPFILSLLFAWNDENKSIDDIFRRVLDYHRVKLWALIFNVVCMPLVVLLTYWTMAVFSIGLPEHHAPTYKEVLLMLVLYFLGAIPEEIGWTYILTEPLSKIYGAWIAGTIIGSVWAIWHFIPWSWAHPTSWMIGMFILNVLMRVGIVYSYVYGGKSLLLSVIFHMQINTCISLFPNNGSAFNTYIASIFMLIIDLLFLVIVRMQNYEMAETT